MNREENKMIEYEIDYKELDAGIFIRFVNEIWPGDYDEMKTGSALSKTMNITAWDGGKLVGCLRVLSDGYYFGTITEMLVLPEYQGQGIGSRLLTRTYGYLQNRGTGSL